jgi:hypothetical protein
MGPPGVKWAAAGKGIGMMAAFMAASLANKNRHHPDLSQNISPKINQISEQNLTEQALTGTD